MKKLVLGSLAALALAAAPTIAFAATSNSSHQLQSNSPMATGSYSFDFTLDPGFSGPAEQNDFYTTGGTSIGGSFSQPYELDYYDLNGNLVYSIDEPSGTYSASNNPIQVPSGWYSGVYITNIGSNTGTFSGTFYWN